MLADKLDSISKPKIEKLTDGYADTIEQFWTNFIKPHLPAKKTVLKWHELLMEYINQPEAMYAIRGFNNAPKERYEDLRRGFLSYTNEGYSFFYTDNFHAAYYLKMALDDYVPELEDLLYSYRNRQFPARFGRDTSNERELMALPRGKDPRIQSAGYKLAHIVNVGKDYYFKSEYISLSTILEESFPRGERSDWKLFFDKTGSYYARNFFVKSLAKKFLIAEFLRFVHPFNYFMAPKKNRTNSKVCKDISEYKPLIEYVQNKFLEIYGDYYQEYLDLIMFNREDLFVRKGDEYIGLEYGLNISSVSTNKSFGTTVNKATINEDKAKTLTPETHIKKELYSKDFQKAMVIEYLTNPDSSFRKLEKTFLKIDSKSRGGGFIAKKIINSYGITAAQKGMFTIEDVKKLFNF